MLLFTETPRVHPAEARLARFYQKETVSFRDIGMNSMSDLVETFEELDEAIRNGNAQQVRLMMYQLDGGVQLRFNFE